MNDAPDATKPTDDPLCTLCITLPASLRERLKAEADANQRSESGQIRYLLTQHLVERDDSNEAA